MENASKALIIAGSIMITGAIVGIIFSLYAYLRNANDLEVNTKEISQIVELNKKIEDYNKDLVYGTDILSLINLIEDYNIQESEMKGYRKIEMQITINKSTPRRYLMKRPYEMQAFLNQYNALENSIKKEEEKKYNLNGTIRTIEYFSKLDSTKINELKQQYPDELANINADRTLYIDLINEKNAIKTKQFKCMNVTYSGERISSITFDEKVE